MQYTAVLFITSTFGEGAPPPSAVDFFAKLKSLSMTVLAGLPFAVMAIGNTVYPDFCQAGIDLNKGLAGAGGKQLLPLKKGDEVNGQQDAVLQWVVGVGALFDLEQKKALVASGDSPDIKEPDPITVELIGNDDERVGVAISEEQRLVPTDLSAGATARFLHSGYKLCQVAMNKELVDFSTDESEKLFRSTRYLEFNLDGISQHTAQDLIYETGDHARILPVNDTSVVLEMCDCLGILPSQWINVQIEDGRALPTSIMRVGDLLSLEMNLATQQDDGNLPLLERMLQIARHCENTSVESKAELARLEGMIENIKDAGHIAHVKGEETKRIEEEEKCSKFDKEANKVIGNDGRMSMTRGTSIRDIDNNRRRGMTRGTSSTRIISTRRISLDSEEGVVSASLALIREDGKKKAIAKITEHYVTVPALLKQFPITLLRLTIADCIETVPRLSPRHYSIASSSEMYPDKLQLSVGKLTIAHKSTGQVRKGVCSHFLAATTAAEGGSENGSDYGSKDDIFCAKTNCFVRLGLSRSTFRLPNDYSMPVVMVSGYLMN